MERHQIGRPNRHYRQLAFFPPTVSEGEIQGIAHDAPFWRHRATREYGELVRFFQIFRHATPAEHKKHWLMKPTSIADLLGQTAGGRAAKYFYEFSSELLSYALYEAVRINWRRIAEEHPSFLFVQFNDDVGASEGKLTNCVRFALSYPTGLVHSQPILGKRKPAESPWLHELDHDIWPDMEELYRGATIDEDQEWD